MNTAKDEQQLTTAGELARTLNRSTYGVKKALKRLGIHPEKILSGTSYYDRAEALRILEKEMRSPNELAR